MATAQRTIMVCGMIAADPHQGGATWAVLQYLLGFRRLGHDVYFVEPIAEKSFQPADAALDATANAAYFRQVVADFDLGNSAALLRANTQETVGLDYQRLLSVARQTDVLINISGMLTDPELTSPIPVRVYLDLDPAFIQLWHATQGIDMRFAGHTHFITVGLAIGQQDCPVPTCGLTWLTTLPPVVLEQWPMDGPIVHNAFTTVGNWRGYGSIEHGGDFYGQKAHSLRRFMTLPRRTRERFLLALAIHPGETRDLDNLRAHGWGLLDPSEVAATPARYRRFIQESKAEFGIAKSGYVVSCSGWFSDRSACYLASGRPVLAQQTGFSRFLPTGKGLLSFTTEDEALAGIEAINRDYLAQSRAARVLAEERLDSDKVLSRLLRLIGVTS